MPNVVLIEDDRAIAGPLVRSLEKLEYSVKSAYDGLSGLDMVLTSQPDLVILDIMLPEMDGWEVCKQIRKTSVVPILILTALNDEIDRVLGLELGADDYLTKPFSTRELIAHIKALLRRVEFDATWKEQRSSISFDRIKIDLEQRQVYKN